MKKTFTFILVLLMTFVLTACGSQSNQNHSSGSSTTASSSTDSADEKTAAKKSSNKSEKVLIAYFTPANNDTTDTVSSATPRAGNTASVQYLAELINKKVNGKMAKITAKKAYSTVYNTAADQAQKEQQKNARPKFTISVNPEDYDVIFVGYPIWWGEMPMVMNTFFDTYNFSGKTIIPFNAHQGSGDGGTYDTIAKLEPKAKVLEGFNVNGEEAKDAASDLNKWLDGLDY